ncbi:hypothetical protein [Agromyces albus]|uniref:Uncharacterized protein n=1 Tax=Agromyces albus TaxID=205332 RepID=A0A4Q2L8J1_9MICO|nr:hypothetical protein [Agromyces albus]RXZ72923.1 hypothetical protein ESP51_01465 [Agromyces albus]
MAELTIAGAFTVTIGHGDGPEVIAFISACRPDGSAAQFDPQSDELQIFTGLTAMFGTSAFPCEVTDVQSSYSPPPGFVGVTLQLTWMEELGRLNTLGVAALGVIIDAHGDRGQGVLTFAAAGTPQTWWSQSQQEPPMRMRSVGA